MKKPFDYSDIISLERPISKVHKPMAQIDRAAQFAPFSALVGYEESIEEAHRLTERRIELSESEKETLDYQLQLLQENPNQEVEVTYFVQDVRKSGGHYQVEVIQIKKIDDVHHVLITKDKKRIPMNDIIRMEFQD